MEKLIIATHNTGKLVEIRQLLKGFNYDLHAAGALGLPEPEETGISFEENALLKARSSAHHGAALALADDSGLEIDALDGAPGIYSARWAGESKDFTQAMQRIEQECSTRNINPHGTRARFVCALALVWPDDTTPPILTRGTVEGHLSFPPRGQHGFGYDPIFIPDGDTRTFAELDPAYKQSISHRAQAFTLLIDALKTRMKAGAV